MSDSTSLLALIAASQSQKEVTANALFNASSPATLYGLNTSATSALTWAYYGGRWNSAAIANGTIALTASATNYIVALRSTGAVSVSADTTNWDNEANYMRLYLVVTGTATVTSYQDHRQAYRATAPIDQFLDLTDTPASYTGEALKVLRVNAGETALEFVTPAAATTFLGLSDTPAAYTGEASKLVRVNAGETALEFVAALGTGDVVGPASSVDNTLPRFDSTSGKLIQASGVLVGDADEISGYKGNINAQTGTTYTLVAADTGKVVECTNASAITLTLPADAAVGFCCTVVQGGAGQITLTPAGSATRRNRQSHTKTAGQWAGVTLYVRTNAGGSAAEYVMCGDSAA